MKLLNIKLLLISDKESDLDEKSSSTKPPVDIVSAAIMAKVLEERERERLNTKHCDSCTCPRLAYVDSCTQTSMLADQSIMCVHCGSRYLFVLRFTFVKLSFVRA